MALTGVVKSWEGKKGFGFLLADEGQTAGVAGDIFVHRSSLNGVAELNPGDKVTFDAVDDGKSRGKFKAINVESTGPPAETGGAAAGSAGVFLNMSDANMPCSDKAAAMTSFLEAASAGGASSTAGAMELVQQFVFESSLGCPFLVVAAGQLVEGVPVPSQQELTQLIELVSGYISSCEARRSVVIADFEGEMPGHGGVITTVQLQVTHTINAADLTPSPLPAGSHRELGLLVHLEAEPCISLMRTVMQSQHILKIMWGVAGDCESLMYQAAPVALQVTPEAIIDAKVAFMDLGMARMLEHLSPKHLEGLPQKEQIDFDACHASNRQALPIPMSHKHALYSVDDLHRIEAILLNKIPGGGNYEKARDMSNTLVQELRGDPCGLRALKREFRWFEKATGIRRTVKAVEIMRHIMALRLRKVAPAGDEALQLLAHAETCAATQLKRAGVVIPEDLSFVPATRKVAAPLVRPVAAAAAPPSPTAAAGAATSPSGGSPKTLDAEACRQFQ